MYYIDIMDAYVEVKSLSTSQLVLRAWLVPTGLLGEFSQFFGALTSTIEANTTVFLIDADQISEENPVLAHKYDENSVFFDFGPIYQTLTKDFHLYYWEWLGANVPLNHIPGTEQFTFYCEWVYKDTPPNYPEYPLYPYNEKTVDAGNGYAYICSSFPQNDVSFGINLVRWFTDASPPLYRHVVEGKSTWLHYLHGYASFLDYTASENPTKDDYRLLAETVPPAFPSYTGTNMTHWEAISQEFADEIEIDTDNQTYYYLTYGALSGKTWRSVLQGKAPVDTPGLSPNISTDIMTTLIPQLQNVLGQGWVKRQGIRIGLEQTRGQLGSDGKRIGSDGKRLGSYIL